MEEEITVRACTAHDRAVWKALNHAFIRYEYQAENIWEDPSTRGDAGDIFDKVIKDSNSPTLLFLVEKDGAPIGFMNAVWFWSVWAHGKVLFLDDFYIHRELQGRGYGKRAIRTLEKLLQAEGFARIQLMAEDSNPGAVRFYQRVGYRQQRLSFYCKYL